VRRPNGAGRPPEGKRPAETTDITAATAVSDMPRITVGGPAGTSAVVDLPVEIAALIVGRKTWRLTPFRGVDG
jgi:hypothetical protein